jgi:hypothetical protein
MSLRGEVTETYRRQGEHRIRDGLAHDDDSEIPPKRGTALQARPRLPGVTIEPEAWFASFGVRCGAAPENTAQ